MEQQLEPPAVVVDGLHKRFRMPAQQIHTLKERALHPFRTSSDHTFEALEDVSFAVAEGEFFGIVGRNGSGKSTLLKCLAGIYAADAGKMYLHGKLATFIELGVGFNLDLAARDNIRLNGVMQGLSAREAREREDEVIRFAGLEEFVDLKIKNYSSGMLVRLGFSIMAHVDADVLIIDEVLAVGDAAFQQKCFDEFNRIREAGKTVLFVTHDMGAVERYCDRALLLEKGKIVAVGDPHEVGQEYLRINFAEEAPDIGGQTARTVDEEAGRSGDGRAEILQAWFEAGDGQPAATVPHGETCAFAARVRVNELLEDPLFGVVLQNDRGETVLAASSHWVREHTGTFRPGEELTYRIRFENVFSPGRYQATPAVAHRGAGIKWIDRREQLASVVVTATQSTDAAVIIPYDLEIVS